MIQTRSSTSATNDPSLRFSDCRSYVALAIAVVTLAGLLLRSLRIDWQPLWWDEGYSVFFATEPLGRMLELTAADIHPPLYYAFLHGWVILFGSAQPAVDRYASILVGTLTLPAFALLSYTLFPRRPAITIVAVLLLALNPMHIFYSQEVRMYGLALLLGIGATLCIVRSVASLETGAHTFAWASAYVAFSALLLHSLYYGGFLVAGHALWALACVRRSARRIGFLLLIFSILTLLCLPWWIYAAPKLADYVFSKVMSDQDVPLTPWVYGYRHLVAFGGGHLQSPIRASELLRLSTPLLVAITLIITMRNSAGANPSPAATVRHAPLYPLGALATFILVPTLLAYLVNLRFPFFPDAGERLLLFVLPYLLLLLAVALAEWPLRGPLRPLLLAIFLLIEAAGVWTYYTLPRYVDHDYRPIVADVIQQGTEADSVLALFPWQVGYWRAYAPQGRSGQLYGPQPSPVDQSALEWTPDLQGQIAHGLKHGALWFPEPRSFGSQLPAQIHDYLRSRVTNLVETWYSDATLLSAWIDAPTPALNPMSAQWGRASLTAAGAVPAALASANQPIVIRLQWQIEAGGLAQHVSLRLLDGVGRVWASRDYEPIGQYDETASNVAGQTTDRVGLLVPAGMPPGKYTLVVGVNAPAGSQTAAAEPGDSATFGYAPVAAVQISVPAFPLPAARAPADTRLTEPIIQGPALLLGYSGLKPASEYMAGTALRLRLAYQSVSQGPPGIKLSLALLDGRGSPVAGDVGWPLPDYPIQDWPAGALVTVPADLQLPADLTAGRYTLVAGLSNPLDDGVTGSADLAEIQVVRRPSTMARLTPQFVLEAPVQFGSHALLYGYDLAREDSQLHLVLYWEVLQSLLPPHHIFVHFDTPAGVTLAQVDGPPQTAIGSAPTGSWLPGEYLATVHTVPLPDGISAADLEQAVLRVGLYEPQSETRLPAARAGVPSGDSVELPLLP